MKLHILLNLATIISSTLANDGVEYYGGRRKRRTHGLNSATMDRAAKMKGQVRYDRNTEESSEIVITRDDAPPPPKIEQSNRLRNAGRMMKDKTEELLMLPDRYSVLNFEKTDGVEEQELSVESSWWGRLYVQGFPSPKQYFRAHFGRAPPDGEVKLLLASPLTMCDDISGLAMLDNDHEVDSSTVIVAKRGSCTFGDKATLAHELGSSGILFINNEAGNFHPSAPIAHDLPISAAMIAEDDGVQLIKALNRVKEANEPGYSLKARYVALVCGDERVASSDSNTYCHPLQPEDKAFVDSLTYKGKMSIEGSTFEYLQGEFGSWMDSTELITVVPSIIGGDSYCCDEAGFEGNWMSSNHAVLCQRGECSFATKAENVGSTGASLLIVSSNNSTMYRMGVDPPQRGRKLSVATCMVSLDAYDQMVDAHYSQLDVGLNSTVSILQPIFSNDSCYESEDQN